MITCANQGSGVIKVAFDNNNGDVPELWDMMGQVVELKPDWPKGHSRLGTAKQGLGDWDDAIDAYKRGTLIPVLRGGRLFGW